MGKLKKPRYGPPSEPTMDILFYNQILDVLRHQQDLGVAYYGNFVYEPKPVPAELYGQWHAPLLPHIQRKAPGQAEGLQAGQGHKLGLPVSGSGGKGGKRLTAEGPSLTPNARSFAALGRPRQGGASQASGQRLGSLSHMGGYTPNGTQTKPGTPSLPADWEPGPIPPVGSLGKDEEFPAARIAVDFIQEHRERYGGLDGSDDWKQTMMELLEQKAATRPRGHPVTGPFTDEEDAMLLVARFVYGNKWSLVDKIIPGRGAGAIKKHWHSTLRDRYRRARWCSKLLAPPNELAETPRTKPLEDETNASQAGGGTLLPPGYSPIAAPQVASGGRADSGSWWLGRGGGSSSGARERVEEPGPDEDEQASLQADAAELEAARASQDPALYKRVLHMQYLRHMAACETSCREDGVWEDVCFICKTAEKPVGRCQWGRGGVGGEEAAQSPCFKACHSRCLAAGRPPPAWQFWTCPRHQCAVPSCGWTNPKNICRSCPNSYCALHLPATVKDAEPQFQALPPGAPAYRKIICPQCQEVEQMPKPSASSLRPSQQMTPVQQVRYQHQQQQQQQLLLQTPQHTAALQVVPLQGAASSTAPGGRPSSSQRATQRQWRLLQQQQALQQLEEAQAPNGEAAWMRMVESIRPLPTNNGGPTVDRIKRAIEMLRGEESMNDIREILETSISQSVYKSNSAGATKNMALTAVEKARRRLAGVPEGPSPIMNLGEGVGRGRKQLG